ncbi:unnamed protein product [Merluccius merluccius]
MNFSRHNIQCCVYDMSMVVSTSHVLMPGCQVARRMRPHTVPSSGLDDDARDLRPGLAVRSHTQQVFCGEAHEKP